jgi:predicted molibdopterin-dependent oxidoreductase YjgC
VQAAASADLVVVLDAQLTDAEVAQVAGAAAVVVLGTVQDQELACAQIVLPVTNVAEENGVFVNRDLRAQRYQQARTAPGMARPAWWVAAQTGPGRSSAPGNSSEAFAAAAAMIPELAGLSYADLGLTGRAARGSVSLPAGA